MVTANFVTIPIFISRGFHISRHLDAAPSCAICLRPKMSHPHLRPPYAFDARVFSSSGAGFESNFELPAGGNAICFISSVHYWTA
jgi:hypothetical protein